MKAGIILFAHGSREPQWARPFESLAAAVSQKSGQPVRLAYLELMQPALGDAIAALIREGMQSIRVVPVFLAAGRHLKDDLPRLIAQFPGVSIDVDPPIGEQPSVIEAIAAAIARGDRPSP